MRQAERLRYLILAAQREGNRQLTARLAALDLTPAQSEALRIVADHGPLPLKDLGDMLVCDTGTSPSRIVDRLVVAGSVTRITDDLDRRRVTLTVTPQGRDRARRVAAIEDELYDRIDDAVEGTDASGLLTLLEALTDGSRAGAALANRLAAETPAGSGRR